MEYRVRSYSGDELVDCVAVFEIYFMDGDIAGDFTYSPRLMRRPQQQVHLMAVSQQAARQIGSDESAAACDQRPHDQTKFL
jgi:hypothetical protein